VKNDGFSRQREIFPILEGGSWRSSGAETRDIHPLPLPTATAAASYPPSAHTYMHLSLRTTRAWVCCLQTSTTANLMIICFAPCYLGANHDPSTRARGRSEPRLCLLHILKHVTAAARGCAVARRVLLRPKGRQRSLWWSISHPLEGT